MLQQDRAQENAPGKVKKGKSFREGVVVQKRCLVGASHGQTGEEKLRASRTTNRVNAMRQDSQNLIGQGML